MVLAISENECIAYYRQNGIFVRKLYITIEQGEEKVYVIKYKDADTNAIALVQITNEDKVIPNQLTKVSGQKVMDCLLDAYSNQGWASVWLTVQSALIWETAAVVAIACIVHNA